MSPVKRTRLVTVYSLSHVQLFCDPMDCNPPGSSVHEISQARILEWVATFSSRGFSQPRDRSWVSYIDIWVLHHLATREDPSTRLHLLLRWLQASFATNLTASIY